MLQNKKYNRDDVIAIQGDTYGNLFVVIDGSVSSEISDPAGKRVKLEIFEGSSIITPGIIAIDGKKIKLLKKTALKYLLDGEILD